MQSGAARAPLLSGGYVQGQIPSGNGGIRIRIIMNDLKLAGTSPRDVLDCFAARRPSHQADQIPRSILKRVTSVGEIGGARVGHPLPQLFDLLLQKA